jgi:hypothetical protein
LGLYRTKGCSPRQEKKVKNYCEIATKKANEFGIGDKFQSILDDNDTTISCTPPPIYEDSCGGRSTKDPTIYLNFKKIPNTYPCNLSATTLHEVSHLPPLNFDEADAYSLEYRAFPSEPRFTPELFNDAYRHTSDTQKQKYRNYYENNFQ